MYFIDKRSTMYFMDLYPPTAHIPRATQIQCDEGDSKSALGLVIAEYHMVD